MTPYVELPEQEKESDRKEARAILELIQKTLKVSLQGLNLEEELEKIEGELGKKLGEKK